MTSDNEFALIKARAVVDLLGGLTIEEAVEVLSTAKEMLDEQAANTPVDCTYRTEAERRLERSGLGAALRSEQPDGDASDTPPSGWAVRSAAATR